MVNINSLSMQFTFLFFGTQVCGKLGPVKGAADIFKMSAIVWFQPSAEHMRQKLVQTAVSTPVTVCFW